MIGIIGAMECEMESLIGKLENRQDKTIHNYTFHQGNIGNTAVVLVMCGIGKVNAGIVTTLLINNFDIKLVINTGIAGGVAPLMPTNFLIGEKLCYHDFDIRAFNYEFGQVPKLPQYFESDKKQVEITEDILKLLNIDYHKATILTGDQFMSTAKNIFPGLLNDQYIGIEMEGTAIAQTCHLFNTPFLSLRMVSDIVDSDNHVENYFQFEKDAGKLSAEILLEILKKQ